MEDLQVGRALYNPDFMRDTNYYHPDCQKIMNLIPTGPSDASNDKASQLSHLGNVDTGAGLESCLFKTQLRWAQDKALMQKGHMHKCQADEVLRAKYQQGIAKFFEAQKKHVLEFFRVLGCFCEPSTRLPRIGEQYGFNPNHIRH